VPDPLSLLRFVALVVFIGLVAVGLWLLDVAWWVVPPVMAGALLIAWTIEWVAWRGSATSSVARETPVPIAAVAPPLMQEPAPVESLAPRPVVQAEPPAPAPQPSPPSPEPEPPIQPEPPAQQERPPLTPPAPTRQPEPEPAPPPAPEPPAPEPPAPEPSPPEPPAPEPPAPEPPTPPPPVATPPPPEEEAPRERRRPRRLRLRSVPAPQPEPEPVPATAAPAEAPSVVEFRPRTVEPREWNLWDLERLAREEAAGHPERRDEWSYLFLHLRQFATADGSLPTEFDGLVRESFGGLLERPRGV
jgi:hypothetical protein